MWNRGNQQMRFVTVLTVILCWAAAALAAPTVADIETLINKGDLAGARTGIEQVIKEKPNSAKAYYLYAQILHAQRQDGPARQALSTAELLNPAMDFASSAYLAKLKAELGMAQTPGPGAAKPGAAKPDSGGWGLLPLVGLGLVVLVIVALMRSRARQQQQWREQQLAAGNSMPLRRDQALDRFPGSGVGPPGYGPTPPAGGPPGYAPTPPAGGRPGLKGAAAGFLAGLAGGALADSLFNRGHGATTPPPELTPTEPPLNLALEEQPKPTATAFDTAGLGDNWDGSDANVASDNSSAFDTPADFDSGDDWS